MIGKWKIGKVGSVSGRTKYMITLLIIDDGLDYSPESDSYLSLPILDGLKDWERESKYFELRL